MERGGCRWGEREVWCGDSESWGVSDTDEQREWMEKEKKET